MADVLRSLMWPLRALALGRDSPLDDETVDKQAQCLLLNQPTDIIFMLSEYMPPESSVALTLTCKLAYLAYFPTMSKLLDTKGKQNLLMLREKSLSRTHFFCHQCTKLHRFYSSWSPGRGLNKRPRGGPPCKPPPELVSSGDLKVAFFHVRLVMNAHLYGSGHGLSLRKLEGEFTSPNGVRGWQTSHTARISEDNQLFLCVTHQFLHDPDMSYQAISLVNRHSICLHVSTHPSSPRLVIPVQVRQLRSTIRPCYQDRESCPVCLTDYMTTIKRRERWGSPLAPNQKQIIFEITIVSYHQLGRCRDPSDPVWEAFSKPVPSKEVVRNLAHHGSTRECRRNLSPEIVNRLPPPIFVDHWSGAVQRQWDHMISRERRALLLLKGEASQSDTLKLNEDGKNETA